ncbi:DUF11 domain-containing protein [Microbulbifer mangrovi]|uniref:DUF11 domain-containing protein n=1 Tax=Microbulbifer mangrovi TaxID=927787 RepID=UPI00130198A1|nr:DUF11 domain-containing protein [Microbulbifer mangrovi]
MRWLLSVALLLTSGQALAAYTNMCVVGEQNPPSNLVQVTEGFCFLCSYGYVDVEITNPYRQGTNAADGDEPYETQDVTECYNPPGPGGNICVTATQSRRNSDYGSSNPSLRFDTNTNDLVINLSDGLEYYATEGANIPGGGSVAASGSTINIRNMADLAPGDTRTVRVYVHRPNDREGLYGANPTATASINYRMADGCNDDPGQRYNFRNNGWYDNYSCSSSSCSGDLNNPPTDFWDDYSQPLAQDTRNVNVFSPQIQLNKQGWNYDSGQREGTRSDRVYGHNDDDIVWRINISNTGDADLQDLRVDDVLNRADIMDANYVCPTADAANAIASANGVLPGGSTCVSTDALTGTVLQDFEVADPFGQHTSVNDISPAYVDNDNDTADIRNGSTINLYIVGKIHSDAACTNAELINTFQDVQFGCEAQPGPGGIDSGETETAVLNARYGLDAGTNALRVERQLTGVTGSGPVGMRGLMTITLRNEGRGTVWFDPGMAWHLNDELPSEYVVDPSFEPTIENAFSLYGSYEGRVDTLEWVNANGPIPGTSGNEADYLNNSNPEFKLTSSSTDSDADQAEESTGLMRHGDVIVIRFAVVMKDKDYFDRAADLDVLEELPTIDLNARPEPTDPDLGSFSALDNTLTVQMKTLCDAQGVQQSTMTGNGLNDTFAANDAGTPVDFSPEELDVNINEPTFIITDDRSQTTPLSVTVTNRGGDEARDFSVFISFGATINVVSSSAPAGFSCAQTSITQTSVDGNGRPMGHPDPYKVWAVNPAPDQVNKMHMLLPSDGTVYQCQPTGSQLNAALAAGSSATFNFEVNKTNDSAGILADDLTFRADVVGEIFTLSDFTIAGTQVNSFTENVDQVADGGNRSISSITINNPTAIANGNPLWFPVPGSTDNVRSDGEVDRGNLYSLDAHWSRGIGFNLKKDQVTAGDTGSGNYGGVPDLGVCNENTTSVTSAAAGTFSGQTKSAEHVQIGEECTVRIQTGGWFGFDSRGFNFIGVRDIQVLDQIPNGQSFISSTVPLVTPQIFGATQAPNDPSTSALGELTPFGWRFTGNQNSGYSGAPDEGTYIVDIDEWFTINATSRVLNKLQNNRAAPNAHGLNSANILDSSFKGIFFNNNTGDWETYEFGSYGGGETVGYPKEPIRRVDVVVTEPRIEVVKEICAASDFDNGTGSCGAGWTSDYQGAVTTNDYIYRLTVTSEAAADGHPRPPVYDLTVEDTLPDLLFIEDLDSDGIDNDGDGTTDEPGEEGVIVGNVMNDGNPTTITFSHTQGADGTGLRRLESGASVHMYYRVDPDDRIAPSETLTNNVQVTYYDSLEGSGNDHGNQTVVTPGSGELGGARIYPVTGDTDTEAQASMTFSEPTTEPKTITALSETPLAGSGVQQVKIGEEIEYTLTAELPVAQLRALTVTDELPAGMMCADAPTIDLTNDAPWSAAGFKRPDLSDVGDVTPICSDNQVQWSFGDVVLTNPSSDRDPNRFTFELKFIARVQNSADNNDTDSLINGVPATNATLEWRDEGGTDNSLDYGQVEVQVTEPLIALTKSWDAPSGDIDAADTIIITLTATNNGTASAYNLRILDDLLDSEMTFVPGSVEGANVPDSVDTTTFGANQPVFVWNPENPLAPGDSREFTFEVTVDDSAQPHQQLENTAEAVWTSLPGQGTALNPAGQIGVDGAADGQRIGVLPHADDAINDYETNSETVDAIVAGLALLKEDVTENGTTPESRAIGAHRTFRLDISLPEGVTENVVVTDTMSAGYAIADPAHGYEIRCEYGGTPTIRTINDQAPDTACGQFAGALPQNGDTGVLTWNIGKVETETEDDTGDGATNAIDPVIHIYYVARIENTGTVVAGTALSNSAELDYLNAPSTLSDDAGPIEVAEPALTVTKTASAASAVSGDLLDYTIEITNATGANVSTAYDVNIADLLPEQLRLDSATVNGADYMPGTRADGAFVWGRENGDNSLDIAPGETLTLIYNTTVLSAFGSEIENIVHVDWTSLDYGVPGQDSYPGDYQRHGEGCPDTVAPNEYCTFINETVATQDSTDFSKTAVSDAWGAADRARIGDTVQYTLNLGIQPGITRNVVVTDELPAGLELVSVDSIDCGINGFTCSQAPIEPAPGATGTLQWQLGDIDAESDSTPPFTIVYTAVVLDDETVFPAGSGEIERANSAELTYDGATDLLDDQASIWVVQPNVTNLQKTDSRSGVTSPHTVVDIANEVMNFRLQAQNTGGAPAYGMVIADTLNIDPANPEFNEGTVNVTQVLINNVAANYTHTVNAGIIEFTLTDVVPESATIQIDYEVGLNLDIPSGHTWYNRFHIDKYVSNDIDGTSSRLYEGTSPACESTLSANCFQLMTSVADPEDLTLQLMEPTDGRAPIGEPISYRITVPASPIASSTLADVQVENTLQGRDTVIVLDTVTIGGNPITVPDGEVFTIDVGDIPPNEVREIVFTGWVANVDAAQSGQTYDISATYTYDEAGVVTEMGGQSATVTIVEPELALTQSAVNQSGNPEPVAGDVYHFTLQLAEQGANGSDAYDLSVLEELSIGWAYEAGSATFNGVSIAEPVITGDGIDTAQSLTWDAAANTDIPVGETRALEFDVRVLDSVLAGQELTGSTTVQWTSQAGAPEHVERDGSDMPDATALNNYFLGPEQLPPLAINNTATLEKNVISETAPLNDGELRIGDLVTYELRLGAQRGTLPNAIVTDTLPEGMVFVDTVSIAADGMTYDLGQEPMAEAAGDITWNFGSLVNTAGDELVITYRSRVQRDVLPLNAASIEMRNAASFQFDTAAGPSTPLLAEQVLNLLQPDLEFALTATPDGTVALTPDQTITFTATITNNGTAPAYDIVLRDVIPVGMRKAGVETVSVNGSTTNPLQPTFDTATGETVWNFANEIPAGDVLEVVYQVTTDSDLAAGLQIGNNAFIEWYYSFGESEIPEGAVLDNRQPYGPSDAVSVLFSTPDAQPLQIAVEPTTREQASIGEPFVYRLTIPAVGALHDVAILMDLADSGIDPVDLAFVEATQVSGNIAFNPQGSVDGGLLTIVDNATGIDIEAGSEAVIDVTLRLRDTDQNQFGNSFSSRASYSYSYANDDPDAGRGTGEVSEYSAPIEVVEPYELVMTKTGDAQIQSGLAGRFTLDVHNRGTGPAWDLTVRDFLPSTEQGGMCETPPANFTASVVDAGGNAVATLSEGSDFTTVFDAENCTLTFTTSGAAAALPADHHLQFAYDAWLDENTVDGTALDNVAGAERWYSWDSTGPDARIYERTYAADPPDGTPSVEDHEDVFTVIAAVPSVLFEKVVENITSTESPATTATPGDVLQYTLTLRNLSDLDVDNVSITDELDRLNAPALFVPGTLQLITAPAGADSSATNAAGGANGSGLVDVRDLTLGAAGSGSEEVQLVYQVQLINVIDSASAVLNQAQVQLPGQPLIDSDDPNINGAADPQVAGDEDPTRVIIESAPVFKVEKTSEDLTGEPDSLMPGDTLRYTIRVENIGNENMLEASLRDQVPANTVYVAGSTTLNGAALEDIDGSTPLAQTLVIPSPDAEEGQLLADPDASGSQAAIITFDVTINDVNDGTVISNQGFANGLGAGGENIAVDEQPSDDPTTEVADDPTIDIVGNVPLLRVQKTVELAVDNLTSGIVDPEDVLRYTITISNMGGKDATEVRLVDLVPENTTYVADSTTLNGLAVADNGGESPLVAGLPVSSDDLTPPMPADGEGVITTAQTATIVFDVMVNADTERGTIISNQGSVYSLELPLTLSDADGNSSNGAQPTEVVVGDAQQLSITKEVAVVGGGAAESGKVLEYIVRVTNISAVPASLVSIYDDLLTAGEGVLTYVEDSARLNGQPDGVMVDGPLITVDYSTSYGDLEPSETITLRFEAKLGENLAMGYTVLNTAQVKWNDPPAYNEATVAIDIGGTPGIANLSGYLWHDVNFSETADSEERLLSNWTVDLYFNNAFLETVQSDENGYFQFAGLVPNMDGADMAGANYELRYSAPNAVESTASLGIASSDFTNGPQEIREIYIGSGANPQNLNLPITPNGVIYDSVVRAPIAGARVRMLQASSGQALPDSCFEDPAQQNQVTLPGGYYKFDLNFSSAACAMNTDYLIEVEVPNEDYMSGPSQIIPPQTGIETGAFDVSACLGSASDLIPGTPNHCEIQLSELPPPIDMDARSSETDYYLRLNLDDTNQPGSSQLFNNHIALDPLLEGALALTKTSAMTNVTRSQLVPYTITFTNTMAVPLTDLQLVDYFPAGFKYVAGSANLDGVPVEPEVNGLQLQWPHLRAEGEQTRTMKLLLVVGSGVGEGKYINRARMFNELSGQQASGEASATVRVVPDPTFDCTDVIGKVYDDKNLNGYQDSGEGGVAGARVVTAQGLRATTDAHGRFHITCAAVPNPDRGSNFVLKLDDRSLPSGYRLTTENPRVERATRGKMLEFNFGTSLHRVVRLDLAEAVFEPGSTELRPQWHSRTELLLEKLQDAPSVLRLSYLAENEDPALVDARLETIKARIAEDWAALDCCYPLNIETEIFWRRGAPPSRGGLLDGLKRSVDRALGNDGDQGGFH